MENQETFMMIDENGQEKEAKILNLVEINEQEYIVYAISKNEKEDTIYVKKIIKDELGQDQVESIQNEEEKRIVLDTVRQIIENLD